MVLNTIMETKIINRFTKLDGLRGLLSIVVALNHSFLVIAIPSFANVWGQNIFSFHDLQSKLQQIFMLLGNGGVAVTMFFILSGLVMGESLSRIALSIKGVLGFYIKRMTRIYPAYFFLIVFSALYLRADFVYRTYPAASSWFHWWMNFEMTLQEFIRNAFFVSISLGGITWTLRVIVIASFLLPFFYFLTKKTSRYFDIFLSILLVFLSFTLLNIPDFRDLRYLYMFFIGLMLPKFKTLFEKTPNWLVLITLPISLFFILDFRYMTNEYTGGLGESIVSWFFIGLMAYNARIKIFNFLDSRVLQYYGKISYSLYLVHFSVLYMIAKLMFDYLPNLPYSQNYLAIHSTLFIISLILATGLSILVNRYVEVPSVKLANLISEKMRKE